MEGLGILYNRESWAGLGNRSRGGCEVRKWAIRLIWGRLMTA
jgi:hypothetical protein